MRTTGPHHSESVRIEDERHAVVETPDHEIIDIEACSSDELEAKLHDLEAWAS